MLFILLIYENFTDSNDWLDFCLKCKYIRFKKKNTLKFKTDL